MSKSSAQMSSTRRHRAKLDSVIGASHFFPVKVFDGSGKLKRIISAEEQMRDSNDRLYKKRTAPYTKKKPSLKKWNRLAGDVASKLPEHIRQAIAIYKRHWNSTICQELPCKVSPGDPCLVPDCTKITRSRGLCNAHYARVRKELKR